MKPAASRPLDVTIVGAGMIVTDQLLPSLYQLQRLGAIGKLRVCDMRISSLRALHENADFAQAFPGQTFEPLPGLDAAEGSVGPDYFGKVLDQTPARQIVVVAIPDQFHYGAIMTALKHDQHVLSVKPLCLKHSQGLEIGALARERGLFVGIEYHKRFDRRALLARRRYQARQLGEFICGEGRLVEPYYYRHSNFQNWFTTQNTDPFVYIGCHYVDQVYFITGLKPVEVSVAGARRKFPNGNDAFMWSIGRVRFENGALLSLLNGLGYPDQGGGSNEQGLTLYFEGDNRGGYLRHNDQFRGVEHSFLDPIGPGTKHFCFVNPDYLQFVPWEGAGLKPVGYGYESVAAIVGCITRLEGEVAGLAAKPSLAQRQALIAEADAAGIIATPANSDVNELVQEAARLSIVNDGARVGITYGDHPGVAFVPRP